MQNDAGILLQHIVDNMEMGQQPTGQKQTCVLGNCKQKQIYLNANKLDISLCAQPSATKLGVKILVVVLYTGSKKQL